DARHQQRRPAAFQREADAQVGRTPDDVQHRQRSGDGERGSGGGNGGLHERLRGTHGEGYPDGVFSGEGRVLYAGFYACRVRRRRNAVSHAWANRRTACSRDLSSRRACHSKKPVTPEGLSSRAQRGICFFSNSRSLAALGMTILLRRRLQPLAGAGSPGLQKETGAERRPFHAAFASEHHSVQCPSTLAAGSTCADSTLSLSSSCTASARIAADSRSSGSGASSAAFSRAASLTTLRSLACRPSSAASAASGSSGRPSALRCCWRDLRLASWRSRSARRSASLSETYFFARSARNSLTSSSNHWNSLSCAMRASCRASSLGSSGAKLPYWVCGTPAIRVHGSALS